MGYKDEERALISVVETQSFIAAAKECMNDAERMDAVAMLARNPEEGDLIQGGGGIRKVRFGIGGRGKRGGVRIIYYFLNPGVPIFMLTVFAKNERVNLGKGELQQLASAAKELARRYGD